MKGYFCGTEETVFEIINCLGICASIFLGHRHGSQYERLFNTRRRIRTARLIHVEHMRWPAIGYGIARPSAFTEPLPPLYPPVCPKQFRLLFILELPFDYRDGVDLGERCTGSLHRRLKQFGQQAGLR